MDTENESLDESLAEPRTVMFSESEQIDSQAVTRAPADLSYDLKAALPAGPRYARSSLHASGGMGSVWLAHDSQIGRDVALKELRAAVAAHKSVPMRFLREARITGQLEHPGVVPVYEIGQDATTGRPYYTMRFVRGRTLVEASKAFHANRLEGRDEPLEFVTLLSAFVSVCHTIAYAHSHGVVHRDLKGENIILGDFGEVIVLDWGLAKRFEQETRVERRELRDEDNEPEAESAEEEDQSAAPGARSAGLETTAETDSAVPNSPLLPHASGLTPQASAAADPAAGQTLMGQVMGTPAYMAPEQAQGRLDLVGPRTDIFGIGAILYEILASKPPFSGGTTVEVLARARQGEIVPPRKFWPDVPPSLEVICLKALSKDPADRYAAASDLAREVQGWQDRQRRKAEDELRRAGERLMHQQAALVRLTKSEVFSTPDLIDIFRRMVEVSAKTLGVERVSIWRYTPDRRAILCHALYELSTGQLSSGVELRADDFPSYFEALLTSEVIAAHDARQDPRTSEFTETYLKPLDIGAIMDAPIHIAGIMDGVVCHEHVGSPRTWTPDEQLFAIAIGNLVSQAIGQRE